MRQYNLQLQEYNRMAKERIRYGADEVTENTSEGTLTLKGHAWWRLDRFPDELAEKRRKLSCTFGEFF